MPRKILRWTLIKKDIPKVYVNAVEEEYKSEEFMWRDKGF